MMWKFLIGFITGSVLTHFGWHKVVSESAQFIQEIAELIR